MIAVPGGMRIVVAARPVDFRNGLDGLAALVQQALRENPFAGDLFVFRAKRADRVKILAWGRHRSVSVAQAPGEGPFCLAAGAGWGDSPECRTTRAAAGGTGLVAGAAKASDCAIIGRVTGQFCGG